MDRALTPHELGAAQKLFEQIGLSDVYAGEQPTEASLLERWSKCIDAVTRRVPEPERPARTPFDDGF